MIIIIIILINFVILYLLKIFFPIVNIIYNISYKKYILVYILLLNIFRLWFINNFTFITFIKKELFSILNIYIYIK